MSVQTNLSTGNERSQDAIKLMKELRPMLELVFPDVDFDKDADVEESKAPDMVDFFRDKGVTSMEGIGRFDEKYLNLQFWDRWQPHQRDTICSRAGVLCDYVAIFDVTSFCSLLEEYKGKPRAELMEEMSVIVESHMQKNGYNNQDKDEPPKDLDFKGIPLRCARGWLKRLLQTNPVLLVDDSSARKDWLDKGGFSILEHFPSLTSEPLFLYTYSPFYFFLMSGFERAVVEKVHRMYPQATSEENDAFRPLFCRWSRNMMLPLTSIKIFLELVPDYAQRRIKYPSGYAINLLEFLFYYSRNEALLELVLAKLSKNDGKLILPNILNNPMDVCHANIFAKIIPKLTSVYCFAPEWTEAGFNRFLTVFADAMEHDNKLQSLELTIPMAGNQVSLDAMKRLLRRKRDSLESISFVSRCSDPRHHSAWLEAITEAICTSEILDYAGHVILKDFSFLLATGATERMFSSPLTDSVEIGSVYTCLKVSPSQPTRKELQLDFNWDQTMDDACWLSMCQRVANLKNLKSLHVRPLYHERRVHWIPTLLNPIGSLARLKTFFLGPQSHRDEILDITNAMVSILNQGFVECLTVTAKDIDHDGPNFVARNQSYRLDMNKVCQALENAKRLLELRLEGLVIDGKNVTTMLLHSLESAYRPTCLRQALVHDDKYWYTIPTHDLEGMAICERNVYADYENDFERLVYSNYRDARRIDFLLSLNRCRRSEVRDTSTVADLVDILVSVSPSEKPHEHEKNYHNQLLDLWKESSAANDDLNPIYCKLRESPRSWCFVLRRHLETFSISYGLLRECPDLWCAQQSSARANSPLRKRRRL